jgi:hypothetical protein
MRMTLIVIKTSFCYVLMMAFLIMAFITNDAANGQLFASLGIIAGAYSSKFLSTKNITTDEKY